MTEGVRLDAADRVVLAVRDSAGAPLRIVAIIKGGNTVGDVVSTVTFWPSTQPAPSSPLPNALTNRALASAVPRLTKATTGIADHCCARAASGQAAADPAIPLMRSRRRIAFLKA
jgi:hypothetical protein